MQMTTAPRKTARRPRMTPHSLTPSKDGAMRMDVQISTRLSLSEMAIFLASGLSTDIGEAIGYVEYEEADPADLQRVIAKRVTSKRRAVELASLELLRRGEEIPHYRVGDDNLEPLVDAILAHLQMLWSVED
jgi:hypothetical protein